MKVKVFSIPFEPEKRTFNQQTLDEFMKNKTLVDKNDYLFEQDGRVYMAMVVEYEPKLSPAQSPRTKRVPVVGSANATVSSGSVSVKKSYEPKNLNEWQRKLYEKMRQWRYTRASEQSIPAYKICTNRQLEMIVRKQPTSLEQLSLIEGMGEGKLKPHGTPLIKALSAFQEAFPSKNKRFTQKIA